MRKSNSIHGLSLTPRFFNLTKPNNRQFLGNRTAHLVPFFSGIAKFLIAAIFGLSLLFPAAEALSADSPMFGLGISINDPPNAVSLAKLVGANAIRIDAPWKQIEKSTGNYAIPDWLEKTVDKSVGSGIKPLLILAYGNPLYDDGDKPTSQAALLAFARYASFVVQHFKGRVLYYDLWNEWDAHTGKTTPLGADEYVNLAKVVFPKLKAIDPNVQILGGGISDKGIREGFFERFFMLEGQRYIDGLSIHPYVWNSRKRRTPEGAMELVDFVATLARKANSGKDLPVYLTEIGWPAFTGKYAASEDEVAWYLTRYYTLAASRTYVRGIFWYCLMDQGNDPSNKEHRFGVLDRNQQARAAAKQFKNITGILQGNVRVAVRQDGKKWIAEVAEAGKPKGVFTWEEEASPDLTRVPRTQTDAAVMRVEDVRAPQWQPSRPAIKGN